MFYSLDLRKLRKHVVKFVNNGGSKIEASNRYEVGRDIIYRWLSSRIITEKQIFTRKRKLDIDLLIKRVKDFPEDRFRGFFLCLFRSCGKSLIL